MNIFTFIKLTGIGSNDNVRPRPVDIGDLLSSLDDVAGYDVDHGVQHRGQTTRDNDVSPRQFCAGSIELGRD